MISLLKVICLGNDPIAFLIYSNLLDPISLFEDDYIYGKALFLLFCDECRKEYDLIAIGV